MTRNLNRLTLVILGGFAIIAVTLMYWSVLISDSMLARSDNPRLVEAERAIMRGAIYDRNGQILAHTVVVGRSPSGQQVVRRDYPQPDTAAALGYYSLVHGVGGAEASFDQQLRGDDLRDMAQVAVDSLFHRPETGSDVRLTLDVRLQSAIIKALKGQQGAVIVFDVPSGAVLAMVSEPSYDPNKLDENYDALRTGMGSPLLNRVTQGLYQPGGSLETIILAAMLTNKADLAAQITDAGQNVQVNGLTLSCAAQGSATTLRDAYSLACPAEFVGAVQNQPGPAAVQKMFDSFGLLQASTLANFETVSSGPVTPLDQITDPTLLTAQAAGQGDLTVTPIQMAFVAATIANHGNTITAQLADATRKPGTTDWQTLTLTNSSKAVLPQDVTDQLAAAMQEAVAHGAAHAADRPNLTIHGHASIAYTGPSQQQAAWFIGYVDLPNGHSAAVAVVIENAKNASVAADVGGSTLQAAAQISQ
jgi:peptidoglycan glycosyltransferase